MDTIREQIKQAQEGSQEAKERIISENAGLIWSVVRRFYGRGYEPEDLYQVGVIGLLKCIEKFDFQYDVRFSTYAVPMILGEIKRFLRDDGMLKVSRPLRELSMKAAAARERMTKEYGREITILELAKELDVEVEELVPALEAGREVESLSAVVFQKDGEGGISVGDCIAGKEEEAGIVDRLLLQDALEKLPERERRVIVLRYFQDKTQVDIAKALGISQVQVSRMEKRILRLLRQRMKEG